MYDGIKFAIRESFGMVQTTKYKVDAEPNNGSGQADVIISMGQKNQSIVEFKLASNSTLAHVFYLLK